MYIYIYTYIYMYIYVLNIACWDVYMYACISLPPSLSLAASLSLARARTPSLQPNL